MSLFDFNFYSGDVHGESPSSMMEFFKIIGGAIFGIAVTKGYEWLGDKKRIKRSGTDLINEVLLLEEPIKKQVESVNNLIVLLKEEKTNIPQLTVSHSLNTSRIKEINRSDVVKYFEGHYGNRKMSRKKVNQIYVSLDIIYYNHEQTKILFNSFLERGMICLQKCKESTDKMAHTIASYQSELQKRGVKIESDNLIYQLSLLFKTTFKQEESVDFILIKNSFYGQVSKILNDNRTDDRVSPISALSYNCNEAIKEYENLKKEIIFKFSKINESLEEQMEDLIEYTKEFNN